MFKTLYILRIKEYINVRLSSAFLNRSFSNTKSIYLPKKTLKYKRYQFSPPCCEIKRCFTTRPNTCNIVESQNISNFDQCENEDTLTVKGKVFAGNEAFFHHNVLENSNLYSATIYEPDPHFKVKYTLSDQEYNNLLAIEDWKNKSVDEVVESFISLGVYSASHLGVSLDNKQFDIVTSALVDKCQSFSDDQLIDCLICLQIWPQSDSVKAHNFLKVWKCLDDLCHERYNDWTMDKTLFMMDLWYQVTLTRLSKFVYKGLVKVSRKCNDLTRSQIVQTLFYMSCVRKISPLVSLHEYEYYIQKYITQLSIEEIGIFALGLFKTKTPIHNSKILQYMMQRVVEEAETIPAMTLTAINKILRLSYKMELCLTTNDYIKKVVERRVPSLSLVDCIHLIHISTQGQLYSEEAVTALAEKFCNDPSAARLKDMERIAFILSMFNYNPPSTPNILDIMVEQLDSSVNVDASKKHTLVYLSLIYFLSLMRVFPEKHIRYLLSQERLDKYSSRFMVDVQNLTLDYNWALEGPPGAEHLLSPKMREYLAKRHSLYIPDGSREKNSNFDTMMLEVLELTEELLGGEQYYLIAYTLPHYPRADILFRLDETGKPVAIPEEMRARPHFLDVVRPEGDGWRCVVIGGRNMYMHNVPKLIGEQVTKQRQLRLLGYSPIVIPAFYWKKEDQRKELLKLKYFHRPG